MHRRRILCTLQYIQIHFVLGAGEGRGQQYEVNILRKLTPPPLMGTDPLQEPWKLRIFWGPELAAHVYKITNVPALLYSPWTQWFWLGQINCSGYWKGLALIISLICTTETGQFLYFVPASFIYLPPPTPRSCCWANMFNCLSVHSLPLYFTWFSGYRVHLGVEAIEGVYLPSQLCLWW